MKADDDSVYGKILQSLGHNKFKVYCSDALTRIASIRGNMRKRVWMQEKDIVLCSLREGDPKFCDIELKYTDEEISTLKEGKHLSEALLNAEVGDETITNKVDFSNL
ncbi:translation initiation factor 1 IF-1 [Ecytonucleospora hepatopenaei]|uniref:Translation initiation factor 1 IF-1 n=1 Tax=Ecytonucleospora hepatopenaei TaxID=646526 RepID=A0A1W0E4B0_9MICR|nr:translation initiation factor 1 IF-1 [Ecytonucleospora hepatopenaei]